MKLDPRLEQTKPAPPPGISPPISHPMSHVTPPAAAPKRLADGRIWAGLALAATMAGGGGWWWLHRPVPLPEGIVASNGRLEMDEIDIQTKFAERVASIAVDEGAVVKQGQVLARMDTSDMQASLAQAQAQIASQQGVILQAQADLAQARTTAALAVRELARTQALAPRGFATQELLDQRRQQLASANDNLRSLQARIAQAAAAADAATQAARLISVNIADNTLTAPVDGAIQYRLVNVGEVLPAGGKLYTLLDTQYAYMDIFLPTMQAGLAAPGREARIVLDARPDQPLAAHVIFLADQNQFTPKLVETKTERDKLMFRVRVRVDQAALAAGNVQAGLPAMAYIRTQANAAWPALATPHATTAAAPASSLAPSGRGTGTAAP